ncbi:hypothetical protein CCAX7_60010 [Capsulimonas corticalis]|uniref:Uncharacterized protein n=1 Tax=Capsulimonas corticalis TaxID=2219043 RepID=A0A402CZH5_9BACT|nr:hypothetical protein [Capsulimonas corticalis]BDI33950.1 hypothetical protein CCAX7_60010 [Capsulimonas corticalis]
MTTSPARLYVILAREAPVGVIFRRGPSRWVQVIHWDTATDTFTPGQWLHARLHERRSDISPNGKLMIYFAVQENRITPKREEFIYSWTAISKPPYLTALALWPLGQSWGGGGMFLENDEVWLNHPPACLTPHEKHKPQGLTLTHVESTIGEEEQVYQRLERNGWRRIQDWQGEYIKSNRDKANDERIYAGITFSSEWYWNLPQEDFPSHYVDHAPGIHERPNLDQTATLVMKKTRGGGDAIPYGFAFSIRDNHGQELQIEKAEWADWDQQGRLVYARDGKLFEFTLAGDSIELADFNDATPEQMVAPEWAKTWDGSKKEEDRP